MAISGAEVFCVAQGCERHDRLQTRSSTSQTVTNLESPFVIVMTLVRPLPDRAALSIPHLASGATDHILLACKQDTPCYVVRQFRRVTTKGVATRRPY